MINISPMQFVSKMVHSLFIKLLSGQWSAYSYPVWYQLAAENAMLSKHGSNYTFSNFYSLLNH